MVCSKWRNNLQKQECLFNFSCVDYSAEDPGGAGSVFCPGPPAGETHVQIYHIQEKKTSSSECECSWNFNLFVLFYSGHIFWHISDSLQHQEEDRRPLMADDVSINARQGEVEGGTTEEEVREKLQ